MVSFAIIELEDGLTIASLSEGQSPEEAALQQHGVLVDAGPYPTYDDAYEALCELEDDTEEG